MSRSMIKRIQQLTFCLVILFAVGAMSFVSADPVLVFNAATGNSGANQNQSVGWQFNVTTALTVTGLSWYDEGANGLVVGHTVGIWNPVGTLLTSVFVPAGTVGFLDGLLRTPVSMDQVFRLHQLASSCRNQPLCCCSVQDSSEWR